MGRKSRYTPEQIAEFQARDAELAEGAYAALADPATVTDMAAWLLTVRPSILRLSLRNQTLLWKQGQERGKLPTDVRTRKQWRDVGRSVVMGMRFNVTVPHGKESAAGEGQGDGAEAVAEAAQAEGGEETPTRTRFFMRAYFDVSDTVGAEDGDAIEGPDSVPALAGAPEAAADPAAALWARLAEQVAARGYTLGEGEQTGTDHDARTVTVAREGVTDAAAAAALGVQLAAIITHQRVTGTAPAAAAPVALPEGVERVRLDLGEHYGTATVDVRTTWETGATLYTIVRAPRMSGAVTVTPGERPDAADAVRPDTVSVHLGDGTRSYYPSDEDCRRGGLALTVNGIEMAGGLRGVTLESVTAPNPWRRGPKVWNFHRRLGRFRSTSAPDATSARASALVRAVLLHWHARPDLAEVREVVARRMAPSLRAEQEHAAARLAEEIAELEAKRQAARERAAAFADVLTPTNLTRN